MERKDERVKKSEFDIKMKTNDMFAFMLRQQYSGMRGIIVLLLNIIVVICLVLKWTDYDTTAKILMFFILIIFDIYLPGQLFVRAKSQVLVADRFQEPTHYEVDEKGITVSQAGEILGFEWGHFLKYKVTGKRIYVYTSRITAFIIPKDQINEATAKELEDRLAKNKSYFGTKSLETALHILPEDKNK